jgi:hypothetical protein
MKVIGTDETAIAVAAATELPSGSEGRQPKPRAPP